MKNTVLWILSILVGLNLLLTVNLTFKLQGKTSEQIKAESANPLPDYITKQTVTDFAIKVVDAHNSQNIEAQWDLYGEYAKAQGVFFPLLKLGA